MFVFSDWWFRAGKVDYALKGRLPVLAFTRGDPRGFAFFHDAKRFLGKDGILVTTKTPAEVAGRFERYFARITPLGEVQVGRRGRAEYTLYLYRGERLRAPVSPAVRLGPARAKRGLTAPRYLGKPNMHHEARLTLAGGSHELGGRAVGLEQVRRSRRAGRRGGAGPRGRAMTTASGAPAPDAPRADVAAPPATAGRRKRRPLPGPARAGHPAPKRRVSPPDHAGRQAHPDEVALLRARSSAEQSLRAAGALATWQFAERRGCEARASESGSECPGACPLSLGRRHSKMSRASRDPRRRPRRTHTGGPMTDPMTRPIRAPRGTDAARRHGLDLPGVTRP